LFVAVHIKIIYGEVRYALKYLQHSGLGLTNEARMLLFKWRLVALSQLFCIP